VSPGWVAHLGVVPYDDAVALQERLLVRRAAGEIPDTLLLLEHPPTITLGRGANRANLLLSETELARQGIELREAARGGDVTYHAPGQLVGYPIFDLDARGRDLHRYLRGIEAALIAALTGFGVCGATAPGFTGVWVGLEKIAAIGVGVRRWVSWHGFALNVALDPSAFAPIVPCGIRDRGVTSLHLHARPHPTLEEAADSVLQAVSAQFHLELTAAPLLNVPLPTPPL
jgi:lipoate-protein ligase B